MGSKVALDQSAVKDGCERASRIRTAVDQLYHRDDQGTHKVTHEVTHKVTHGVTQDTWMRVLDGTLDEVTG